VSRGARARTARTRAVCAAASLVVAGCLAPPAPRDRYYRLEVEPPPRLAAPAFGGVLEVERFSADSAARGTALAFVAEDTAAEVRSRAYDHWVDSPTLLLQREIARSLRAAGVAREVVTPDVGVEPDHRLGGRLARFEEVRGPGTPRVRVEVEVAVVDLRREETEFAATYREERGIAGPAVGDVVRAYGEALSAVLARLAADAAARSR
jgi:ABC-type uncharacterized transport system auxiliary subunit